MPVEQLPRRYPAPQSALRRRPGSFPRVSSPLSSGVVETSGPSNPSISYKSLPIKQPPPSQPSSPRKRKISQSAVSRLPPPRKRIRSSRFDLDPPVEALGTNILASALNQTFQCNSTSGSRHAPTTPVTTSGVALVNNALSIPKPLCAEPQYKDIAIQTGLNFTRQTFELALMVDQSSYIATLEEQQRVLQAALEASERRCQSLQESLEEISRRYVQVAGSQPHVTTLLPSTSTSHSVSRPQRQVQHITPDNQLHPIHAQEPEHPPIETLRPLTPPWQEGSWRLPDSISTPAPPRRTTPTEPHSSGQRVAVQQERGRGNVQQGSREQYRHGSKKHSQRGSNFGTASKGRGRGRGRPRPPSPPPTQSVRPTDGPIPSSSLSIIEAKSSYPLSPTATVHSATMVQGRGGPKDHMLPSSANDKQPPLEGPKAEES
ncbi:hypothetical protein BS17DRAFT_396746 [Gyrodon lividus]|nr:hypothetical protein BS17DRAFT_396746 [Gyrodon lividus]